MHLARLRRRVVEASGQKFTDGPDVIGDPLRHRWRHPQRLVHAAKIEMGDKQPDRRKVVISAFAETVRQAREAARGHAKRKVLSLRVAGRNVARNADHVTAIYRYYIAGAIAARSVFGGSPT